MKSRLTQTIDYRSIPIPEKLIRKRYPEAEIRETVKNRCSRAAVLAETNDKAKDGDVVILKEKADYPADGKHSAGRRIHVNIGRNADPDMEVRCRGLKKGDQLPDSNFEVEAVIRREIPELRDELMKQIEPDREITAADYYQELKQDAEDKVIYKTASGVFNIIVNFTLNKGWHQLETEEVKRYEAGLYQRFAEFGAQQGLSPEEAILHSIPEKKQSDPAAYLHELAEKEVAKAASCCYFMKKASAEIPSEDDIVDLIAGLQDEFYEIVVDYVRDIMKWMEV